MSDGEHKEPMDVDHYVQPEPPYQALLRAIQAHNEEAIEQECQHVARGTVKDYLELMSLLKDDPIFEHIAVAGMPTDWSVEPNHNAIADGVVDRIIDLFTNRGNRSTNPQLLEPYIDPKSTESLQVAVAQPTPMVIRWLLCAKADVHGRNLLHRATALCAQVLIDAKVDVNERDQYGEFSTAEDDRQGSTPLHINNDLDTVAILLANKADVNAENKYGHQPLSFATSQAHVKLLLQHGAAINHSSFPRFRYGGTPLHLARNPVGVASLLMARANVESRNCHDGLTPLGRAFWEGLPKDKMRELLCRGSDPFLSTPKETYHEDFQHKGDIFKYLNDELKDVWRKYVRETTTAFLLGAFDPRVGRDSSLRRAFVPQQPLSEIKILRLIFQMAFNTENPHYRALK